MKNEAKKAFIQEQLKNYYTRKYRLECEMEIIRRGAKELGDEFMKPSVLEDKEAEVTKSFAEVDIAIDVYEKLLDKL